MTHECPETVYYWFKCTLQKQNLNAVFLFFFLLVSFAGLGSTLNMMIYMFNITCIFSRAPKIQLLFFGNYYCTILIILNYRWNSTVWKKLLFDQNSLKIDQVGQTSAGISGFPSVNQSSVEGLHLFIMHPHWIGESEIKPFITLCSVCQKTLHIHVLQRWLNFQIQTTALSL